MSDYIESPLPAGWPFMDYTPEQKEQHRLAMEEMGRRAAERQEQRILDAILGTSSHGESKPAKLVYEAVISRHNLPLDAINGRPVYASDRKTEIGRMANARHTPAGTIVDIEPLPGKKINATDLCGIADSPGASIYGNTANQLEPQPESWRDRPPLL